MAHYRLAELDLSTRVTLAVELLRELPEREWGLVTELAERYGVSREFLYQLRDRALAGLSEALAPKPPGPQPQAGVLVIDRAFIERAIVVLSLLKGSVRDIQTGLELLFEIERSTGHISQILRAAGRQAEQLNQGVSIPLPILGEADEIFQGRQPCLTIVDGRSFLAVHLGAAESRDKTTWGLTYLELAERGVTFQDLACDGGTGLRAGLREAELAVPLRPDLFHLLRDAHRLTRRLEKKAYDALAALERARLAQLQAQGLLRRRGPRLKSKLSVAEAQQAAEVAMDRFDCWCWLVAEIRQALEPLTLQGQHRSTTAAQTTLETAITLLKELDHPDITAFAADLDHKRPELMAPLLWLEEQLTPLLEPLDPTDQAFVLWAWQQRHDPEFKPDLIFSQALYPLGSAIWEVLALFHRSSSLAESLHSWLRPYLQIHRGMPDWLLPLLQLFWNHHQFKRGKRAGHSPLELAGLENVPALAEIIDQLFNPNLATQLI